MDDPSLTDKSLFLTIVMQVRVSEASRFINASEVAARLSAQNEADRVHINRLLDPRNVHRTHPMLRNVASDAGGGMFGLPPRPPTVPDDPQTAQLKALVGGQAGRVERISRCGGFCVVCLCVESFLCRVCCAVTYHAVLCHNKCSCGGAYKALLVPPTTRLAALRHAAVLAALSTMRAGLWLHIWLG
jgi:hypothetical protein